MRIAYFTNQYPKPSHSFIRREILAVEAAGHRVSRFSIRRQADSLADPSDREEFTRTRALLAEGFLRIAMVTLLTMICRPWRFLNALCATSRLAQNGERPFAVYLIYLAEACMLRRLLDAKAIQHLHVHFGTNSAAVAMLCHMIGGPPYSLTIHGPEEFDAPVSLSLQAKIQRAAFVVAISQFGKSQLCRWIDSQYHAKFHLIQCGLDEPFLMESHVPTSDDMRFVFVGRLTVTKGVHILLDALVLLRTKGFNPQVTMIGDGPERHALETRIKELDLCNAVHLMGWTSGDDVKTEILRSWALVLPSFAEGLPIVLMEALALCRPVISTWVAGIPELVENGINGWLIPPGSSGALADAMEQALKAPIVTLQQMGVHGRQKVLLNHNAKIQAGKLIALFEKSA